MTKEEHARAISMIIDKFIKKYKFITAYLDIEGTIDYNVHSMLHISCNSEFDELTIKEVKAIKSKLWEEIRSYLDKNKIIIPVHIITECKGWASSSIKIYFEEGVSLLL